MERVWGGRKLETRFGRVLPLDRPIGESWEVVDREDVQSVVVGGRFEGMTLQALLEAESEAILGSSYLPGSRFPILVKWLDCKERLSLQVHPPATVAEALKGEPKTENWFIADCEPGSNLLVGLRKGATREDFEAALERQTLESLVHTIPVRQGDSILVESGRIHAIDAGNFILEIQQNSDTTYRVYDWGRVGLDGKPRELHVEQSMRSIDFEDFEPDALHPQGQSGVLADCAEFRIRKWEVSADETPDLFEDGPALLHVVSGSIRFSDTEDGEIELGPGRNVLIAAGFASACRVAEDGVVLVTDRFL